jgi:basic membrane lipoprotein Med (substrate-binding protein (PBP1-ABC) superfamily)
VLFDYSGVYEQIIANVGTPDFGQIYTMDVENGGVRLLDLPDSVSQETKDAVDTAKASILDGTIKVDAIGDADGMKAKLAELGYS